LSPSPLIERHILRLRRRHPVSEEEADVLRGLIAETRDVPTRTVVIRESDRLDHSTLLLDGMMCRYKDLASGERQVTEVHVSGDFADMHSFTLKRLDHNVQTLTPSVIGLAPHDRIEAMMRTHPRLARLYWFGTNLDAAIHREWVLSLGRRSATQRAAAFFCELHIRLGLVGMAEPRGFALPITQAELADCLGLTAVHVNRVLRVLREEALATFDGGRVELLDVDGLRRLSEFDDRYLYLDPDPI
jgi:CRP-like cAMP-binding protein